MSPSETCEEKPDKNYKKACREGYCPSLEERKNIRIKELANKLRAESAEKTLTNVQEWQNKNIFYWFERNQLFVAIFATTLSLICVVIGYYEETLLFHANLSATPGFLLIKVRGVGFEPTEAFARGS